MDARVTSLATIEAAIWAELERAVADTGHPWRTPVLATIANDVADARTVVLREVDVRQRQLLIYTDERAGKVAQLLKHPNGTLVMWSPQLGWQLRCRVHLAIEMSGLAASSRWARIRLTPAARDYLSPLAPGTPLPAQAPARDAAAPEHEYFAVINAQVTSIDWLDMRVEGQRRVLLHGDASRWLQP